ncbi:MAG: hypothetical protein J3R72DRAFT_519230 [Linnemannia gamsii]|nr:MAG: hypothetical protein J3R72DRAFT_519230 [Linnemannia gamsii]
MKSIPFIALIALLMLTLASQTTAQLIMYSAPNGATVWFAGQPATISWTSSCDQVVGNTTFPVYLIRQTGNLQVQVPGIPELGYLDCRNPGNIPIQVPATLPQSHVYSILVVNGDMLSYSALFTIVSTISGPAPPITVLPPIKTTITLVTTTRTSVRSLPSTNPSGTGYTLPESGNTKSNGAVIGSAITGVVVVSAIIAFILMRRRQKSRGSGNPEAFVDFDPVLPSMGNAHKDIAEQDKPPSTYQPELKVTTMRGPQIKTASPHLEPTPLQQDTISSSTPTYSSTPWGPPGAALPSSPQDKNPPAAHLNSNPHNDFARTSFVVRSPHGAALPSSPQDKNPPAAHLNSNPQNDFARTSFVVRSPQLASPELVSTVPASYQDLQEQINWMQAELNRRKLIVE